MKRFAIEWVKSFVFLTALAGGVVAVVALGLANTRTIGRCYVERACAGNYRQEA